MQTAVFHGGPHDGRVVQMDRVPLVYLVPIFADSNKITERPYNHATAVLENIYTVRYLRQPDDALYRYVYVYEYNERWEESRRQAQAAIELYEELVALVHDVVDSELNYSTTDSYRGKYDTSTADKEIDEWNKILHPERYVDQ